MPKDYTELLVLIDDCRYMEPYCDDILSCYEGVIARQREVQPDTLVTTALFRGSEYEVVDVNARIDMLQPLEEIMFYACGISNVTMALKHTMALCLRRRMTQPEELRMTHTKLVVISGAYSARDSMTESGRCFTAEHLAILKENGWELEFYGVDLLSCALGRSIGFAAEDIFLCTWADDTHRMQLAPALMNTLGDKLELVQYDTDDEAFAS